MGKEKDALKINNKKLTKIRNIILKANSKQLYQDDKGEVIEIKIDLHPYYFRSFEYSDADFAEIKTYLDISDLKAIEEKRDRSLRQMFKDLGEDED